MANFFHTLGIRDRFSGTLKRWEQGTKRAEVSTRNFANTTFASKAAFTALAGAATLALGKIVTETIKTEQRLAELAIVTTATGQTIQSAMKQSLESARAFSNEFIFSTEQIIGASFELASAGLNVEETIAGIEQSAFLAAAGLGDLRQTAILMGSAFNTVGRAGELEFLQPLDKARRIADSTALAVKKFQITLPILAEGLKFTVGPASQLGISLDELNTALGLLNTAGLRGSLAGTALANVFVKIGDATDKLGLDPSTFTDAEGALTSLADVLSEVDRALPLGKQARFNALIESFDVRAARAVIALLGQVDALRSDTAELERASGAAEKFAGVIGGTLQSELKKLRNVFVNLGGGGLEPFQVALTRSLSFVRKQIELFAAIISPIKKYVLAIVGIIAALAAFEIVQLAASKALLFFFAAAIRSKGAGTLVLLLEALITRIGFLNPILDAAALRVRRFSVSMGLVSKSAATAITGTKLLAVGLGAVLPTIIAITFAFQAAFGEMERGGVLIRNLGTSLEGVSSVIERTGAQVALLGRSIESPDVRFSIDLPEATAFRDLFDTRGLTRAEAGFEKVERAAIDAATESTLFGIELGGLGTDLNKAALDFATFTNLASISSIFQLGGVADDFEELEESLESLRAPVERNTSEFFRLQAAILGLERVQLVNRQIELTAINLSKISGRDAAAELEFLRTEIQKFNGSLEEGDRFLNVFEERLEKAFKAQGIDLPISQVEAFVGGIERSREVLQRLVETADVDDTLDFRTIEELDAFGRQASNIDAIFRSFQDNLQEIEKTRAGAGIAQDFRQILAAAGELENLGTLQLGELSDETIEKIAPLLLSLGDQFAASLKSAQNEAIFLAREIDEVRRIQEDLIVPAEQLGKQFQTIRDQTQSVLGPLSEVVGNASRLTSINRQRIALLEEEAKRLEAVFVSLDQQRSATTQTTAQRNLLNREITKSLELQAENNKQLREAQEQLSETEGEFVLAAQLLFPGSELTAQIERAQREGTLRLNAEILDDKRRPFVDKLNELTAMLRGVEQRRLLFKADLAELGNEDAIRKRAQEIVDSSTFSAAPQEAERQRIKKFQESVEVLTKQVREAEKSFKRLDDEAASLEDRRVAVQAEIDAIDPSTFDTLENQLKEGLDRFDFPIRLNVQEGIANLRTDLGAAIKSGLEAGDFQSASEQLGEAFRNRLVDGITKGLTEGFLNGIKFAAIGDLADTVGRALASGDVDAANVGLRAIAENVKAVGEGLQDAKFQETFEETLRVLDLFDSSVGTISGSMATLKDRSEEALDPISEDVSALVTKFQTADASVRPFVEQLLRIKDAEGTVQGVRLEAGNLSTQLDAALRLFKDVGDAGLDGAIGQDVLRTITDLNKQIEEARRKQEALSEAGSVPSAVESAQASQKAVEALGKAIESLPVEKEIRINVVSPVPDRFFQDQTSQKISPPPDRLFESIERAAKARDTLQGASGSDALILGFERAVDAAGPLEKALRNTKVELDALAESGSTIRLDGGTVVSDVTTTKSAIEALAEVVGKTAARAFELLRFKASEAASEGKTVADALEVIRNAEPENIERFFTDLARTFFTAAEGEEALISKAVEFKDAAKKGFEDVVKSVGEFLSTLDRVNEFFDDVEFFRSRIEAIGQEFQDSQEKAFQFVDFVQGSIEKIGQTFQDTRSDINAFRSDIVSTGQELVLVADRAITSFNTAFAEVRKFITKVEERLAGEDLSQAFRLIGQDIAQAFREAVGDDELNVIQEAVKLLAEAFLNLEPFLNSVRSSFIELAAVAVPLFKTISGAGASGLNSFGAALTDISSSVDNVAGALAFLRSLSTIFPELGELIKTGFGTALERAGVTAGGFGQAMIKSAQSGITAFNTVLEAIATFLQEAKLQIGSFKAFAIAAFLAVPLAVNQAFTDLLRTQLEATSALNKILPGPLKIDTSGIEATIKVLESERQRLGQAIVQPVVESVTPPEATDRLRAAIETNEEFSASLNQLADDTKGAFEKIIESTGSTEQFKTAQTNAKLALEQANVAMQEAQLRHQNFRDTIGQSSQELQQFSQSLDASGESVRRNLENAIPVVQIPQESLSQFQTFLDGIELERTLEVNVEVDDSQLLNTLDFLGRDLEFNRQLRESRDLMDELEDGAERIRDTLKEVTIGPGGDISVNAGAAERTLQIEIGGTTFNVQVPAGGALSETARADILEAVRQQQEQELEQFRLQLDSVERSGLGG